MTPRLICDSINNLAKKTIGKTVKRPWNRFKPDETSWWIVPSAKQPHYKFGKFFFKPDTDNDTTYLLCGLYIEKGLDPSIGAVYSSAKAKRLIMDPTWSWFDFLEKTNNGELISAIKSADLNQPSNSILMADTSQNLPHLTHTRRNIQWDGIITDLTGFPKQTKLQ